MTIRLIDAVASSIVQHGVDARADVVELSVSSASRHGLLLLLARLLHGLGVQLFDGGDCANEEAHALAEFAEDAVVLAARQILPAEGLEGVDDLVQLNEVGVVVDGFLHGVGFPLGLVLGVEGDGLAVSKRDVDPLNESISGVRASNWGSGVALVDEQAADLVGIVGDGDLRIQTKRFVECHRVSTVLVREVASMTSTTASCFETRVDLFGVTADSSENCGIVKCGCVHGGFLCGWWLEAEIGVDLLVAFEVAPRVDIAELVSEVLPLGRVPFVLDPDLVFSRFVDLLEREVVAVLEVLDGSHGFVPVVGGDALLGG